MSRRLGQHFLSDRSILNRIVDALAPAPRDVVIEIGPGKGDLTRELLARGVTVIAIEKDRRLAAALDGWRAARGADRLQVVPGDALRLDWGALFDAHAAPHAARPTPYVIGNIPYYITSPLLAKALTPPLRSRVVFLVQEEVANRVVAAPGSKVYGALTVGVQAVATAEKLFVVKPGSFSPPPKVRSAVVRLTPLAQPLVAPDETAAFRRFVTAVFSRRRKQLQNAVPGATVAGLRALGFDPRARPETLAPGDFVRLLRAGSQL